MNQEIITNDYKRRKLAKAKAGITPLQRLVIAASFEMDRAKAKGQILHPTKQP